tara:strand:+ start:114 stop:356 length:243 start_codon:yes stop_codon:yes gene_type:complete
MIDTRYNITLSPEEGKTNIQVQVDGETGAIKLSVFADKKSGETIKSVFTFTSDADMRAIIDTLKWARIRSLQVQGFTVVT